jgi:plastocyanin
MIRTIRLLGPVAAGLAVAGLALSAWGAVAEAHQAPAPAAVTSTQNTPSPQNAQGIQDTREQSNMADMQPAAESAGTTVTIAKFMFGPDNLTVPVGTTVTWTNDDTDPHTVVAKDGSFRSAVLAKGAGYQHTFDKPGTYRYLCSIHPFMVATVVVTP